MLGLFLFGKLHMKELIFSGARLTDNRIVSGEICMCEDDKIYIFIGHEGNYVKIRIIPDSLRIKTIERS